MTTLDSLRFERPDPSVAVLTLSRPDGPNVISAGLCRDLSGACRELAADDALRVAVLRADGPAFCVGADLGSLREHLDDLASHLAALIDAAHGAVLAMRRLPVPVIASVAKVAAGGGFSLALACDRLLAARSARFVSAYPLIATTPDTGMTHSLAALLGPARALQIVLSPSPLGADEAHRLGIVSDVFDDDALDAGTLAAASQWAALPRQAVVGTKALLVAGDVAAMERQMQHEKASFLRCAESREFKDCVVAFIERSERSKKAVP